jgi:hypothetical protein
MTETPNNVEQTPGERNYAIVCLLALLLVVILLMFSGLGVWSVIPLLIGGVTYLLRWRAGPPLVLGVFLLMAPTHYLHNTQTATFITWLFLRSPFSGFPMRRQFDLGTFLEDVLLAVALLTYTAACYRSLALAQSILPPEATRTLPARRAKTRVPQPPKTELPRSGHGITAWELPLLFGIVGVCVFVAGGIWTGLRLLRADSELDFSPAEWRSLIAFWSFVGVFAVSVTVFRYLGRRRAPTEENLLYLQDQLWQQTRREQSMLNRWLVWARLRGQRRKEQ